MVAGLLTLVFRKNHARVRYGLWLAASIKFLIPFSLLIILGNNLAKPRVVYQTETGFMTAMQEASQPFTRPAAHVPSPVAFSPTSPNLFPAILAAIWLSGFAAVLILWFVRWRRIRSIVRGATPVREGRELLALRRVERWAGVRKPIEFVSSQATLEPGIFGIFKPVLIWPQGISPKLEDAHLEAILAHEVWHVRRRDNVASSIHMLVEAIFWFHPMVWWLGSRLVEERERACDEEVLQLGSKPNIYAESILKTCEFCVESPLACVSGITGADLKKRIVHIMTERAATRLGFGRKLLLIAIGLVTVTGPVIFGLMSPPQIGAQSPPRDADPKFEVAAIKPTNPTTTEHYLRVNGRHFMTKHWSPFSLLMYAYGLHPRQIVGGPAWIETNFYDINAEAEGEGQPNDEQWEIMVRKLMADRFKLTFHREKRELSVYAIEVGKTGPKLTKSAGTPNGFASTSIRFDGATPVLPATNATIADLADFLQAVVMDRPVVDETGLRGRYDFTLKWTPDQFQFGGAGGQTTPPADDAEAPDLFTAVQQQLGLKLESTKAPVEVLVIDHIERPSEN